MHVHELLTSFANLYSQSGQFALQHRLLLLGNVDLLHRFGLLFLLALSSLLALQWLYLQGNAVLSFS